MSEDASDLLEEMSYSEEHRPDSVIDASVTLFFKRPVTIFVARLHKLGSIISG